MITKEKQQHITPFNAVVASCVSLEENRNFLKLYAAAAAAKSLQSCLTLCDPMDGSPPGSPIPGILQARTLEWGAITFSENYMQLEF